MKRVELGEIEEEITEQIDRYFQTIADEMEKAGTAVEEKVRAWIAAVLEEKLSLDEFASLVEGEKDLGGMLVLEQKVNARVLAGAIKNLMLEKVVEVVTGFVGTEE